MAAAMGRGVLYANVAFDRLRINDIPVSDVVFRSKWDFNVQRALFELVESKQQKQIVRGYYQPSEHYYRAAVQLDNIDLSLLDPVLKGTIRDSKGKAHAELSLSNPTGKMQLDGQIYVPSFRTTVDYTNVPYTLDSTVIDVRRNVMTMRNSLVRDDEGHQGTFKMSFDFSNLRNLAYNVEVHPNGCWCSTPRKKITTFLWKGLCLRTGRYCWQQEWSGHEYSGHDSRKFTVLPAVEWSIQYFGSRFYCL